MLPHGTQAGEVLARLLVTSDDQHERSLRAVFRGTHQVVRRVSDCSEALQLLVDLKPGTVLVEADLQTGNWKRLLNRALDFPDSPPVIVFFSFADDWLWAEVLNLGGYDVLAARFDADEVLSIISSASRAHTSKPPAASLRSIAAA